ncbi:MAG: MmgE/PrpD family protein, partial [Phycisphaerales bacterium]|nr:MmgE/PrpD family protein [Phycisphaerales bacterium]
SKIAKIRITAYEPAFGIIGDPAKRNPTTRQSADHSMVYIVATLLRKALAAQKATWTDLMLEPYDYAADAIHNERTRALMERIEFAHGGDEYDRRYPDGIPTSVVIADTDATEFDSGMVMYPAGHARNTTADLKGILAHKFNLLGRLVLEDPAPLIARFENLADKSADQIRDLHDFEIRTRDGYE